jgi:RNA polymerase sigma-70 factor (ECF subfamily)
MMKRLAIDAITQARTADRVTGTLMNSAADLIARVRRGDEEAFRLIFERYARPIISFIYDMVGERGLAEELTQETFVRAYKSINTIRDETKLSTWLFGIARNVARESLRSRQQANRKVEMDDPAVKQIHDGRMSPDDDLVNREINQAMHDALGKLDEDKRLVFTLKVFQQQSYEEIAVITGFSMSKLKTDLHRARAEMRRLLRPYLEVSR